MVDWNILNILRNRLATCTQEYGGPYKGLLQHCTHLLEEYEENELNFFIKCMPLKTVFCSIGRL